MAKVAVTKHVSAPQETVWATLADPTRFEDWLTLHERWKEQPPAAITLGSKLVEILSIMGMTNTITFTVDTFDAPNSVSMSGTGMAGATISLTLAVESADTGSEVTIEAEFISQMMVGAIGGAIERASTRELDASLEKFSTLVA